MRILHVENRHWSWLLAGYQIGHGSLTATRYGGCHVSVTLDESTPVVNGFYEIVFPNPPEEVDRVDGPGSPVVWNNSYDGYTHVYIRKCVLDTEIAEANRDQIELELFVKRWTDIPTLSPGIQCYYYVILCLHNH